MGKLKSIITAGLIGLASLMPYSSNSAEVQKAPEKPNWNWRMGFEPTIGCSISSVSTPESIRNVTVTGPTGFYDVTKERSYDISLPKTVTWNDMDFGLSFFIGYDSNDAWKNFRIGRRVAYRCFMLADENYVETIGGANPDAAVTFSMKNENVFTFSKELLRHEGQNGGSGRLSLVGELDKQSYKFKAYTYHFPYGDDWYKDQERLATSEKVIAEKDIDVWLLGLRATIGAREGGLSLELLTNLQTEDIKSEWVGRLGVHLNF